SIGPGPLATSDPPIYIAEILQEHLGGATKVFACPQDGGFEDRDPPNSGKSYFQTEKSSYEYRGATRGPFPNAPYLAGNTMDGYLKQIKELRGTLYQESTVYIMRDYANFHNHNPQAKDARRYLFNDGHVTEFEQN